jgi:lysophospholipase L1-like esterase
MIGLLERAAGTAVLVLLVTPSPCLSQVLVGMGDSIGEGVQSGDASAQTQQVSYLWWVATRLGVPFPLPLIKSGPFGFVGNTENRSRIFPGVQSANLAVSGANVDDMLNTRADAAAVEEIDSETDLVLFPRQGSQVEIVEAINPPAIVCWIGNNDILGTVTSFDHLDASQMTPVSEFQSRFLELTQRLDALDSALVFANIPDVSSIAILLDGEGLAQLTGSDFGLPDGDFTTVPTALLIRLGVQSGSVLQDPNFVLDAAEVLRIQERIGQFNAIIAQAASRINAPVVDIHRIFGSLAANPPILLGIPLTHRFLGGLFSLDGVHPSNIGHALVGDQVIATLNAFYGTSFPRLKPGEFLNVLLNDPFWDKDRDGQAVGRPFASLVETLGVITGITGDPNDLDPATTAGAGQAPRAVALENRQTILDALGLSPGSDPDTALRLVKAIWGAPMQ